MNREANSQPFPLQSQLQILLDYGAPPDDVSSLTELAEATGLSDQTLANLLQGKSTSPRLKTLLTLCQCFNISLDYFACTSESQCREYLFLHRLKWVLPLVSEIEMAAINLSPRGQRNVLAIMEWMRLASLKGQSKTT